jgi:hypothetical protein
MGHRSRRWSGSGTAGLVSVQVVGEPISIPTAQKTLEIECAGGPVVRLREDVSLEVLERVLRVCQQLQCEGASTSAAVRSC